MKKLKAQNYRNIMIFALLVIGTTVLWIFKLSLNMTESSIKLRTYYSQNMKYTVQLPSYYSVDDKLNITTLTSSKGEIIIDTIATNFDNLFDYLADLKLKNHLQLEKTTYLSINNKQAVSAEIKDNKSEKVYWIYPEQWSVYTLSTTSPYLYNDLDSVARSFKYIPK